jgi:hypothetical protein
MIDVPTSKESSLRQLSSDVQSYCLNQRTIILGEVMQVLLSSEWCVSTAKVWSLAVGRIHAFIGVSQVDRQAEEAWLAQNFLNKHSIDSSFLRGISCSQLLQYVNALAIPHNSLFINLAIWPCWATDEYKILRLTDLSTNNTLLIQGTKGSMVTMWEVSASHPRGIGDTWSIFQESDMHPA